MCFSLTSDFSNHTCIITTTQKQINSKQPTNLKRNEKESSNTETYENVKGIPFPENKRRHLEQLLSLLAAPLPLPRILTRIIICRDMHTLQTYAYFAHIYCINLHAYIAETHLQCLTGFS